MENQSVLFNDYAKRLKSLRNVTYTFQEDIEKDVWKFSSSEPNSLSVELYHWKHGADFVGLEIAGVDCGYWHTAEVDTLAYHLELVEAALRGRVAYNRSPLLRLKEVCFKVGDKWECTLTDKNRSIHYIKTRKKLKNLNV